MWIKGFGEHIAFKTPTYADDLMRTPIVARRRPGVRDGRPGRATDVDMASIYDCYTITVLMTLEDAGFCAKGEGMAFVSDHDLTFAGDFPLNTARRPAVLRSGRHGRRHAPRGRRARAR